MTNDTCPQGTAGPPPGTLGPCSGSDAEGGSDARLSRQQRLERIRGRIVEGVYDTPAVRTVVARRILASGDLDLV